MSAEQADVVVVGAGLAGSATARALARRGRSVVLVEAFQPGHRHGSSHGSARIFRRAYPDPLYVRLTGQVQVLWRQLADEAGEQLVTTTGAVDYGPARKQEKLYEILTGFGVPAELMTAEAAAERWPGMSFGPDPVLLHPDGGVIDPERAMAAMRASAAGRGAQISYGTPVLRVETGGDDATVYTADRSWRASAVVVAAGAWLEPLLGGQVPLPPLAVTQEEFFHFAPRTPGRRARRPACTPRPATRISSWTGTGPSSSARPARAMAPSSRRWPARSPPTWPAGGPRPSAASPWPPIATPPNHLYHGHLGAL